MLINIGISLFAITMGILSGLSFIYIDRLSNYLKKRGEVKTYYKFIRKIFVWLLPIVALCLLLIIPGELILFLTGRGHIAEAKENLLLDLYGYLLPASFFITLFIIIKTGRLKLENKK